MRPVLLLLLCFAEVSYSDDKVIELYDGTPKGSEAWTHTEAESTSNLFRTRLAYNVVRPTLTQLSPTKPNGTALVICPGGGFHCLSMDREGLDVAKPLVERGVTCFVLKYRLVPCKTKDPAMELMRKGANAIDDIKPIIPLATQDGLEAIRYVRGHARDLSVDPKRIGLIGFSAGGTLAISVANVCDQRSRPDFMGSIYAQFDWADQSVPQTKRPPLFIAAATDDQLGLAEHSLRLYKTWLDEKIPTEIHIYERGGHGFGMRKQDLPSDRWMDAFLAWMDMHGW